MLPETNTQRMLEAYQSLTDENKRYINAIIDSLSYAQSVEAIKKEKEGTNEQQV